MAAYFNTKQLLDASLRYDFPAAIELLVEKAAAAVSPARLAMSNLYTRSDLSVYWHPVREKVALFVRPQLDLEEYGWGIWALGEKFGAENVQAAPLQASDLTDWWVKLAYSPTLRRIGELLQFFPSKDIPGFGGRPIAAAIASGLLGTGLGYGAGYVGEKLLPQWAQGEPGVLRRRLAAIGGLGGAAAGSVPGLVNWHQGRKFNDPTLWQGFPEDGFESSFIGKRYKAAAAAFARKTASLGTFGVASTQQLPLINTDELGRVLWTSGASPQMAAMTMGAVYGANQMPDPQSRPGVVTPHQMGLFGTALGAAGGGVQGYITGRAIGMGLGLLTGMPESTQQALGRAGAVAGILNTMMPKLF